MGREDEHGIRRNQGVDQMKVLVAGAAGLIGSHLVDMLLYKGYKVLGVDNLSIGSIENVKHNFTNPNFNLKKLDICDPDKLRNLCDNVDVIVHLAATKKIYEFGSATKTLYNNVIGTENLLKIAREFNCKLIFASTSDVYGRNQSIPFKEDDDLVLGPSNIKRWSYAASKLFDEHLCFAYYEDYGVPIVILRYFGTFGPRASITWTGGHAPLFINAVLHNREIVIHGDGKQTRTLNYISDTIEPTIIAMETPKAVGEIINIGGTEEISVIEFAYLVKKVVNNPGRLKIKYIPFKEMFGDYREIMRRVPDLSKERKLLGYIPKVTMRDAIRKTMDWQKAKNL